MKKNKVSRKLQSKSTQPLTKTEELFTKQNETKQDEICEKLRNTQLKSKLNLLTVFRQQARVARNNQRQEKTLEKQKQGNLVLEQKYDDYLKNFAAQNLTLQKRQ